MMKRLILSAAPMALAGLVFAAPVAPAMAQHAQRMQTNQRDAQQLINAAVKTIQTMKANPRMRRLMRQAKGVLIVPRFGRGAFLVGAKGGEGLLLMHKPDGSWSDPVFYSLGGLSIGAQIGGEYGEAAYLLMTRQAVGAFQGPNNFSLNAGAGLSIINYSAAAQGSWGKGDIVFWTNTGGAYVSANLGISDVSWDSGLTRAYYNNRRVTPADIINGNMQTNEDRKLQRSLLNI